MPPNDVSPAAGRGSRRRPGGMQSQDSGANGSLLARDLVQRLELRERPQAIVDELDLVDADVDVPRCIAAGALEELDAMLAQVESRSWGV